MNKGFWYRVWAVFILYLILQCLQAGVLWWFIPVMFVIAFACCMFLDFIRLAFNAISGKLKRKRKYKVTYWRMKGDERHKDAEYKDFGFVNAGSGVEAIETIAEQEYPISNVHTSFDLEERAYFQRHLFARRESWKQKK